MALKSLIARTINFKLKNSLERIQNHIKPSQSPSSDLSVSQSLKIEGDSNDAISISSNEEDKDVSIRSTYAITYAPCYQILTYTLDGTKKTKNCIYRKSTSYNGTRISIRFIPDSPTTNSNRPRTQTQRETGNFLNLQFGSQDPQP